MQTFTIRGKRIDFDDSKRYLDFQVKTDTQERFLTAVDWPLLLGKMQAGEWSLDDPDFVDFLRFMERWVDDGPRKRAYRQAILELEGFYPLTREYFFEDHPDGDQIINDLENTGHFARYLLVTLGLGARNYWDNHEPLPF